MQALITHLDPFQNISVAKKLGLAVLKKIPGFGLLISIPLAINRFRKGDWIGGLLELASGGASVIPGIGTALSIAIDAFSLFRDVKKDISASQEAPPLPNVESGAMSKMISGKDIKVSQASKQSGVSVSKSADNSIDLNVVVPNQQQKQDQLTQSLTASLTATLANDDYINRNAKAMWREGEKSPALKNSQSFSFSGGGLG